jgi:putative transposase
VAHKYKGKYRIESPRLPSWDYASPGFYFITICTQAKAPYFGEVTDEEIHLSPSGAIVSDEWLKTGQIRSDRLSINSNQNTPNAIEGLEIRILPGNPVTTTISFAIRLP